MLLCFQSSLLTDLSLANADAGLMQGLPYQSCNTSCQYNYMYGDDSSTSGALSFDSITIRTSTITNVAFGCGHRNLGTFAGAGGLMGLGQGPLSLISQAGAITSKIFSYCLVPLGINKTSPMYIGDSAAAGSDIAYTPLLNNIVNPSFYYVGLTGISVAGKAVNYPAGTFSIDTSGQGGFILDSGTTLTYLNTAAFTAVVAACKEAIPYPEVNGSSYGLNYCFSTAGGTTPTYPSMVFHFTGVDFTLPPPPSREHLRCSRYAGQRLLGYGCEHRLQYPGQHTAAKPLDCARYCQQASWFQDRKH